MDGAKEKYLLLQLFAKRIVNTPNTNAKIFGGYVRDQLIHNLGAELFFLSSVERSNYNQQHTHPSSYADRTLVPNDIDVYCESQEHMTNVLESIGDINGVTKLCSRHSFGYSQHPEFTTRYQVTTHRFCYTYNESLQSKGSEIIVSVDIVTPKMHDTSPPWVCITDCACNMLHMDANGIHSPIDSSTPVDDARMLSMMVELIEKRVTFIPAFTESMIHPREVIEINAVRERMGFDLDTATEHWHTHKGRIRFSYRNCYLTRMLKLFAKNWKIMNIPFSSFIIVDVEDTRLKGEKRCVISHEDFAFGKRVVTFASSVMLFDSFKEYMQSDASRSVDIDREMWTIVCPVSKIPVQIVTQCAFNQQHAFRRQLLETKMSIE
tara:strand:- start:3987 stop:5120 length:1134 start_codon:yes stop_codon:yes gene_type:complete